MATDIGFWATYKKSIITAIIGAVVLGFYPTQKWIHEAWADDRYVLTGNFKQVVQQAEVNDLNRDIKTIDRDITKMEQELLFTTDTQAIKKIEMWTNFLKREKTAIEKKIKSIQTPKDG